MRKFKRKSLFLDALYYTPCCVLFLLPISSKFRFSLYKIFIKIFKVFVDKTRRIAYNNIRWFTKQQNDLAELCKGSTTDSDSVCEGSNPSSATIVKPLETQVSSGFSTFLKKSPAEKPSDFWAFVKKVLSRKVWLRNIIFQIIPRQIIVYHSICAGNWFFDGMWA